MFLGSPTFALENGRLFEVSKGVADHPDSGGPQSDEQRTSFGIAAFVLIDGLRADPQRDAQSHRREREDLHVRVAQAGAVKPRGQHRLIVSTYRGAGPGVTASNSGVSSVGAETTTTLPPMVDGFELAGGRGPDLMGLHVALDADAPP